MKPEEAEATAPDQTNPRLGQQVGSYEIVSLLGAGGMGEVYLARDATLGRQVALKFLPDFLQQDETARRRFVQEARLAAALDHPFLCKVYEIGEEDETVFISLEYVAGQTLREKLAEGPLTLTEAWKIAAEIAEALGEAHQRGIVHRDLKPANIMFTPDGHVKVMDFGLAKQLIHAEGQEQSLTGMTKTGTTVGTLPYMSPEQVRGQKVDTRSDLFSLGVMLYEMLTGEHPFRRSLSADTAVAILGNEPEPIRNLRPEVTEELESVVMKLLAKEQEDRWQSIEEVRAGLLPLAPAAEEGASFSRLASRVAMALLVVVAAVAVAGLWLSRSEPEVMLLPVPLTSHPGLEARPTFSPDGNQVAFERDGDIYVKQIGTGDQTQLTDTEAPAWDVPAWSPDGLHIAFARILAPRVAIRIIPSSGGPERLVTEILSFEDGNHLWSEDTLAWSRDGKWLAVSARENRDEPNAIFLISPHSGKRRRLTFPDLTAQGGDVYPAFSPDNRTLAFSRARSAIASQLFLLPLSEDYQPVGEEEQLTSEPGVNRHPVWLMDGKEIIFAHGAYAVTRLYRIAVSGPVPMRPLTLSHEAAKYPAVSSRHSRLAFADFNWPRLDSYRQKLPPDPVENPGGTAWNPENLYASTRGESFSSYSEDGTRIAFTSLQSGSHEIWVCNSDGTGPRQLTSFGKPGVAVNEPRWSPDGEQICFMNPQEGNGDICVIGSEGRDSRNLTSHPAYDRRGSWSRDGRFVYFESDRSGEPQVWKVAATGGEAARITENGGLLALESPDGEDLYFSKAEGGLHSLWKMPVKGGEERLVLPKLRFPAAYRLGPRGIYFFSDSTSFQFLPFGADKAIPITAPDPAQAALSSPLNLSGWPLGPF